jgi:hypothetical protein
VIGKVNLRGCGAVIALNDPRRFNAMTGAGIETKTLGIYACALGARQVCKDETMEVLFDRLAGGSTQVTLAERY